MSNLISKLTLVIERENGPTSTIIMRYPDIPKNLLVRDGLSTGGQVKLILHAKSDPNACETTLP